MSAFRCMLALAAAAILSASAAADKEPAAVPVYPGAVRDQTSAVAGGSTASRDVVSYSTSAKWPAVADFYRQAVKGRAVESHEGGLDWLVITGDTSTDPSVQVIRDPGSPVTRIVVFRRSKVR